MADRDSLHYLTEQYATLHKLNMFPGWNGVQCCIDEIARLVRETETKTLLDYGSGKGHQYLVQRCHEGWGGILPQCYDPAVPYLNERPEGTFDGVICCDVLEHIPERHVAWIVGDVLAYARKFAFFSVATRPAKKTLPDGRNCHLTVRPSEFWTALVDRLDEHKVAVLVFSEGGLGEPA